MNHETSQLWQSTPVAKFCQTNHSARKQILLLTIYRKRITCLGQLSVCVKLSFNFTKKSEYKIQLNNIPIKGIKKIKVLINKDRIGGVKNLTK